MGVRGTLGATMLGTGHPPISHLVGAGAVEMQLGGPLRVSLSGVHRRDAARTSGWSGQAGAGEQELGSNRGSRPDWPRT